QVERSRPSDSIREEISRSAEQRALDVHAPAAPLKLNQRRLLLAASALITVTAIVLGLRYFGPRLFANKSAAPFSKFKVTRLTTSGKAASAVISPDGKYVAHVMGNAGQQSLWL